MGERIKVILIAGYPGVGKTTLVQKICKDLPGCYGFFTDEVRNSAGKRIGFDIVTMPEDKRGILAREVTDKNRRGPIVGKYSVFVNDFENLVMPTLQTPHSNALLIIDEIGKMELKSRKFETAVRTLLEKQITLLATIPFYTRTPIPIIEQMKASPNTKIFELTYANRDLIIKDVLACILT